MSADQDKAAAMTTSELFSSYGLPNYGRFPLSMARGQGTLLWDEDDEEYLDFASGVAVCSIGHCHPRMVAAIQKQAERLIHCSNLYQIREQGVLARRLTEDVVGAPGKVFFSNSGAEANEALIKLARRFGHETPGAEGARTEVITLNSSFHGRTLAGIAATAQAKVKEGFAPLMPGFVHAEYNDLNAVAEAVTPKTVAVLLEAVQGEGGVHVAKRDFLKGLAALCEERNLLLLFDEVQCGIGRAGNWCGWKAVLGDDSDEVKPDAVSWAKGLGGGYPLGGIWVRSRAISGAAEAPLLSDVLGPGSHGSTYGGSPLASAVGLAVLDEIEETGLCARSAELGGHIKGTIEGWGLKFVKEVRGLGLMLGIVLDAEVLEAHSGFRSSGMAPALNVTKALMSAHLLTVPAGPAVVRLLPPLTVKDEEVERAMSILHGVLSRLESELEDG